MGDNVNKTFGWACVGSFVLGMIFNHFAWPKIVELAKNLKNKKGKKKNASGSDAESHSFSRQTPNRDRPKDGSVDVARTIISELGYDALTAQNDVLVDNEYVELIDIPSDEEIPGDELVNSTYEIPQPDPLSSAEFVTPIEFVKAVTAENAVYTSVIFSPYSKEFFYALTEEEIDETELAELVGDVSVVDEIKIESDFNANGWIQPRYIHNLRTNEYVKVAIGGFSVRQ